MLFPQLKNTNFGRINLEQEAKLIKRSQKIVDENPLLDPEKCQAMIDDFHRRLGLVWSYGGWMENQRNIWAGSYLDEDRKYLHLGMDYNVKEGTEVALPWNGVVSRVKHDSDQEGGWGGMMIVEQMSMFFGRQRLPDSLDNYFVFAHLDKDINAKEGQALDKGDIIGTVGSPEVNGGWFPHLHVQTVTREEMGRLLKNDLADLDGYGRATNRKRLTTRYPDPTQYISFD